MSVAPIRQLKNRHGFQPYEQNFSYTGAMQEWTVPSTGVYLIELWGASGGTANNGANYGYGANGYYVKSYHKLNKGTKYYIGVGGAGESHSRPWGDQSASRVLNGGYNGGGNGYYANLGNYMAETSGGGGGASHVSTQNATLPNTSSVNNVLCAAGGGGGGSIYVYDSSPTNHNATATSNSNGVIGQGTAANIYPGQADGSGGGGLYGGTKLYSGTCKKASYGSHTAAEAVSTNNGNGKAKITRVE